MPRNSPQISLEYADSQNTIHGLVRELPESPPGVNDEAGVALARKRQQLLFLWQHNILIVVRWRDRVVAMGDESYGWRWRMKEQQGQAAARQMRPICGIQKAIAVDSCGVDERSSA